MLICLSGGRKFLCRMLHGKELDVIFLFEQTDIIIKGVKQVRAYSLTDITSSYNK